MTKDNNSKTVLMIILIVVGVLLLGGLGVGFTCYYLYKVGTKAENTTQDQTQSTANWQTYGNTRYDFSIEYPKTFTSTESINGDGITLISSSPAITIRASGALNSQNQSLDDYLNTTRADLFGNVQGGEETYAGDTKLSDIPAQERRWQYANSVNGTETIEDQVTALKNSNFYTVDMVIFYSDYSEYAPMLDTILRNFEIK